MGNRYEKRVNEEWKGVLAEWERFNDLLGPILAELRDKDVSAEMDELHTAYVRWQDKYNEFYHDGDPHRCSYCGEMFDNSQEDELREHINACEKHPLAEARKLLQRAQSIIEANQWEGSGIHIDIKEFLDES